MVPASVADGRFYCELSFWLEHIDKFNGQNIWPKASAVRVVYSDASSVGFGGYCVEHGDQVVTGQWSEEETNQSSTWRELKAVRLILHTICQKVENYRVRWFTDNQNVARIVLYGNRKLILQEEALAIFTTCVNHHIRLEPEWIPREANEFADYLSKLVDYDDWMLNPKCSRSWIVGGAPIPLIGLPMRKIADLQGSILVTGTWGQKLWTHSHVTGVVRTTGGARPYTLSHVC